MWTFDALIIDVLKRAKKFLRINKSEIIYTFSLRLEFKHLLWTLFIRVLFFARGAAIIGSAWGAFARLTCLHVRAQSASPGWRQPRDVAVRVTEVSRVKASLQLDVRVLGLGTYSIFASKFIFKAGEVLVHRAWVLLEINSRGRPGVSLGLGHAHAYICSELSPFLVDLLLVRDLL